MSGNEARSIGLVVQRPIDQRDWKRFGIQTFLDRGYQVRVLDAADVIHPRYSFDRTAYERFDGIEFEIVRSDSEVRNAIPFLKSADIILNLCQGGHVTPTNMGVLRAIEKSERPSVINLGNTYPGSDRSAARSSKREWLRDTWSRRREMSAAKSIVARIPRTWLGIGPAKFAIRGGLKCAQSNFVGVDTRFVNAHSMDYDIYLDVVSQHRSVDDKAVFVDEFRPFHSDLDIMGYTVFVDPETYYADLCRVFDRIEDKFGLRVVIAASPRSTYSEMPDVFDGREVINSATCPLIAESRLVIGHRSTALAYAVMFGKPILQIATMDNYTHPTQRPYFDAYAKVLGKPIQFYDNIDDADFSDAMSVNQGAYESFLRDYVKVPGSPERKFWDIIIDELTPGEKLGA